MSVNTVSLSVGLSNSGTSDSAGTLLLEQETFDPYIGRLTKVAAVGWLKTMLFGDPKPEENCSGDGSMFEKDLYAYPSPINLNYKIHLSNGILSGPVLDSTSIEEFVQVNLTRSPQLKYPAQSILSYQWESDVYSADGTVVTRPLITILDNRIYLSKEVYGTLRVAYSIKRHVYTAYVWSRMYYGVTSFQSFLVAVWKGGTAYLDIEAPADVKTGECKNREGSGLGRFTYLPRAYTNDGDTTIAGDSESQSEESPYGPVSGDDEEQYIDYCTQLKL